MKSGLKLNPWILHLSDSDWKALGMRLEVNDLAHEICKRIQQNEALRYLSLDQVIGFVMERIFTLAG